MGFLPLRTPRALTGVGGHRSQRTRNKHISLLNEESEIRFDIHMSSRHFLFWRGVCACLRFTGFRVEQRTVDARRGNTW